MTIRTLVVTGLLSDPEDFKHHMYVASQAHASLSFTAIERASSRNELAQKRGDTPTEQSFEVVIREIHPEEDNFYVTVTNVETGDWILINVMDDKVCFELVD